MKKIKEYNTTNRIHIDSEDIVPKIKKSCKDFDAAICTTNMIVSSLQVDKFLDYLLKKDTSKPFINYIRSKGISYGISN